MTIGELTRVVEQERKYRRELADTIETLLALMAELLPGVEDRVDVVKISTRLASLADSTLKG